MDVCSFVVTFREARYCYVGVASFLRVVIHGLVKCEWFICVFCVTVRGDECYVGHNAPSVVVVSMESGASFAFFFWLRCHVTPLSSLSKVVELPLHADWAYQEPLFFLP